MEYKKSKSLKPLITIPLAVMLSTSTIYVQAEGEDQTTILEMENQVKMTDSMLVSYSKTNYQDYLAKYKQAKLVEDKEIILNAKHLDENSSNMDDFQIKNQSVLTSESGYVTFNFKVEKEGFYQLELNYLPLEGKGAAIERRIYIDGELPYDELARISLDRIFADASEIKNVNGNDVRPDQMELFEECQTFIYDRERMNANPLMVYLEKGDHFITIESISEPMQINQIALKKANEVKTYEQYIEELKADGVVEVESAYVKVQGEKTLRKNSVSLYARMNNSNPLTEPSHASDIRLNVIGGDSWSQVGDWVEWEVEVEEEGLYQLSFRANQNFKRGMSTNRALYVNGEIPFAEAKNIAFNYNNQFQMKTVGEDEPMLIHLNKGKNTIKMEVVLGEMTEVINETNILMTNLNSIYRQILLVTGATPDTYRDYKLTEVIPDLLDNIRLEAERLKGVISKLEGMSGGGSDSTSVLHTSLIQLEKFLDYPDEIHIGLEEFSSNNAALGTWIVSAKEQPLEIDYLLVTEPNAKLPKVNGNFIQNMAYESKRFMSSFFNDYNSFTSETEEGDKKIEVWAITGRDQTDILKRLIDNSFTPNTGINVDVKLVASTVVLPATLSGEGPDVVIQLNENLPVDYALRNALVDLSQFDDFEEVVTRFDESALTPFAYSEGVYALPDEQTHQMLFYREDILEELGLEVPQTWDQLFEMLPVLNQNHLDFYMDTAVINSASSQTVPNTTFATLLFQHGGEFYVNDGETSALNSQEGMESFKFWTDFYTNYGLPVSANFYNRMRTGEIPIGIASYTNYNLLSVFAPEISGSWKMAPLPAFKNEDGGSTNVTASYSKGAVIFNQSEDKESAWEFLKWWTSKETQVDYGTEIETVLGVAARHASATEEAIYELPWPSADIEQLQKQRENLKGVAQVPGGYMTAREVEYAFRDVINNDTNPRETLYDYVEKIDSELTLKREEFNIE